jgi:hypothetical protein
MSDEVMTEKQKTESKKLKKVSKDERILMTWAFGFAWLLIGVLISGSELISVSTLAGLVIILTGMAVLLRAARKWRKDREARKYDGMPSRGGDVC